MFNFFIVVLILLFIPGLVYASIRISSIKKENDRSTMIGVFIIGVIVIQYTLYSNHQNGTKKIHLDNCLAIKENIINFQGKYTNTDMNEEAQTLYKLCTEE